MMPVIKKPGFGKQVPYANLTLQPNPNTTARCLSNPSPNANLEQTGYFPDHRPRLLNSLRAKLRANTNNSIDCTLSTNYVLLR